MKRPGLEMKRDMKGKSKNKNTMTGKLAYFVVIAAGHEHVVSL